MPQRPSDQVAPYQSTPALERKLLREREVQLAGGPYRATIARAGRWYEAWTDSLPFVYSRPSETAQAALDSLDEAWRDAAERPKRAS